MLGKDETKQEPPQRAELKTPAQVHIQSVLALDGAAPRCVSVCEVPYGSPPLLPASSATVTESSSLRCAVQVPVIDIRVLGLANGDKSSGEG
jgi:hypothetical protein